eukprot:26386_1
MSSCDKCGTTNVELFQQMPALLVSYGDDPTDFLNPLKDVTAVNTRYLCTKCAGREKHMENTCTDVHRIQYSSPEWDAFVYQYPAFVESNNISMQDNGQWMCSKSLYTDILMGNLLNTSPSKRRKKDDSNPKYSYDMNKFGYSQDINDDKEKDNTGNDDDVDEEEEDHDSKGLQPLQNKENVPLNDNEILCEDLQEFYGTTAVQLSSFHSKKKAMHGKKTRWTKAEVKEMCDYIDQSQCGSVQSLEKSIFNNAKFQAHMKQGGFEFRKPSAYNTNFLKLKSGTHALVSKRMDGIIVSKGQDGNTTKTKGKVPTADALQIQKRINQTVKGIDNRRVAKWNITNTGKNCIEHKGKTKGNPILQSGLDGHATYVQDSLSTKDRYFELNQAKFAWQKGNAEDCKKQRHEFTKAVREMNLDQKSYTDLGAFVLKQDPSWAQTNPKWTARYVLKIIKQKPSDYVLLFNMARASGKTDLQIMKLLIEEMEDTE